MTKRILIGIWVIVLARITFDFSLFWDNCLMFIAALSDFDFKISFSHILNVTAFSALLYFIYCCLQYQKENVENKRLSIYKRYSNTLKDHSSILLKSGLVLLPPAVGIFSIIAWRNLPKMPELFLPLLTFTILVCLDFSKKQKTDVLVGNSYLFTDEPIEKYSQLNEFQQLEVENLKNIIQVSGKEYLSIALNGSWGSGKTSILKGLKNLLEEDSKKQNIDKSNCEVIELNLWQTRTPENAISELENLFAELFNKVYLNVSTRDLAFFSLLAESVNSGLSSHLNRLIGVNETIPTTRDRIEKKLHEVLSLLGKQKLVILIDDLDRIPEEYLNGFLKIICYVTGLENVVTVSGINREKIHTQLQKPEGISIWADGINAIKQYAKEKEIADNWQRTEVSKRDLIKKVELPEKKEFHFALFDNETFLSKIFNVQRELVNSNYYINVFKNDSKRRIDNFQRIILYEDKKEVTLKIDYFIETNLSCFNSFRDLKLFLNEVFIYLIGFGRNRHEELKLSDYIGIDFILAMSWAKIVCPDFYRKVQEYITPFMYQEQIIYNQGYNKNPFNFKVFIDSQIGYFNSGKEHTIKTPTHLQIKKIFDLNKIGNPIREEEATRYFRPIIEPYEFTYKEFADFFNDDNIKFDQVREFIAKKWKDNRRSVFLDFTNRMKLRPFKLSERFISASALLDLSLRSNHFQIWELEKINGEYWHQIVSLFQDKVILSSANKYEVIKNLFASGGFIKEVLELWEKMIALGMDDKITAKYSHSTIPNLFYKFFNASDFRNDSTNETIEGYKFLLNEITNHKFKKPENKVACIVYTYELLRENWGGDKKNHPFFTNFKDIVPIFLESILSFLEPKSSFSHLELKGCLIFHYGLENNMDDILFKSDNIEKITNLFRDDIHSYSGFMDRIKNRIDGCTLSEDQNIIAHKILVDFINSESQYFGQDYEQTLDKFFKIKEITN